MANIRILKMQLSSHTHLRAATSHRTDQSLQKSVPAPPKKNFKIFFSTLQKKLKHLTLKPTMQTADTNRHDNRTTEKEAHAHNKGLPKAGVTSFYDSFVLNRTLVFQINSSAVMPRLRQAPNRYVSPNLNIRYIFKHPRLCHAAPRYF